MRILEWEGEASFLVFGLEFFGCSVPLIHLVAQSYGLKCSLEAVDYIINTEGLGHNVNKTAHSVDGLHGHMSDTSMLRGEEYTLSLDYVDGKVETMIHQWKPLKARSSTTYEELLYSADGRKLVVEQTKGQLKIRAIESQNPRIKNSNAVNQNSSLRVSPFKNH